MAKNFHSPGQNGTVGALADVKSGQMVLVGSLFGVCLTDAKTGADVTVETRDVYNLPKAAADAFTLGQKVYRVAAGDDLGKITDTAAGNLVVGVAIEAALANSTHALVRLNSSF